jgi:hypothetical protein
MVGRDFLLAFVAGRASHELAIGLADIVDRS